MSDTLTYNGRSITRKDVMHSADNVRFALNKALVVRAKQEKIITLSELRTHNSLMSEKVLTEWLLDSEVTAFLPKILGPQKAVAEAVLPPEAQVPSIAAPQSRAELPELLEYRGLSLDCKAGILWWREHSARLSPRAQTVLPLFFRTPEVIIGRAEIFEAVTNRPYEQGSRTPDEVMSETRVSCITLGIYPIPFLKVRGGYKLTITH